MKSKKILYAALGAALSITLIWAVANWRDVLRPDTAIPEQGSSGPAKAVSGLNVPDGFEISVFADDLPGVRAMVFDSFGNLWVSQTSAGTVSLLQIGVDGVLEKAGAVFSNLNNPHGLAFDPKFPLQLYVAEEDKIFRVTVYSDERQQELMTLPSGGNHKTRTISFGPDGRLYVSIGSSCNVCLETNERRAKIFSADRNGGDFREFARGLRNSVFFAWHPVSGEMWATEMGRDLLGDNLPPDEINIVKEGQNYGWPICYGKNIHDDAFDKNIYVRNPCLEPFEQPSLIDLPAHSAPLGLAFIPSGDGWPAEYEGDLLVTFHGSWNRTEPTGYKVVRIQLDSNGRYLGMSDFISGWLAGEEAVGRPVAIVFDDQGNMYLSDDKQGIIYRVSHRK